MRYLICYDIADTKLRTKVAKYSVQCLFVPQFRSCESKMKTIGTGLEGEINCLLYAKKSLRLLPSANLRGSAYIELIMQKRPSTFCVGGLCLLGMKKGASSS